MPLGDALDHRIETLLKDWHHSPDLLYAVHPLDGSFLVWYVRKIKVLEFILIRLTYLLLFFFTRTP